MGLIGKILISIAIIALMYWFVTLGKRNRDGSEDK